MTKQKSKTAYLGARVPVEWIEKLSKLAGGDEGKSRLLRMALCEVYGFTPLESDVADDAAVLVVESQYSKRAIAKKLDGIELRARLLSRFERVGKVDSTKRAGLTVAKILANGEEYSSEQVAQDDWVRLAKAIVKHIDG